MEAFSRISYVHGPNIALIWMCAIAAAMLGVCQINQPDLYLSIFCHFFMVLFLVITMCIVWSIVRFEQDYRAKEF